MREKRKYIQAYHFPVIQLMNYWKACKKHQAGQSNIWVMSNSVLHTFIQKHFIMMSFYCYPERQLEYHTLFGKQKKKTKIMLNWDCQWQNQSQVASSGFENYCDLEWMSQNDLVFLFDNWYTINYINVHRLGEIEAIVGYNLLACSWCHCLRQIALIWCHLFVYLPFEFSISALKSN